MKPILAKEKKLKQQGHFYIAGVDEVGRGAWAGPIVAAAVVVDFIKLKKTNWFLQVKDSKQLSPLARAKIFSQAQDQVSWGLGIVGNKDIDKLGIGAANIKAVNLAVADLEKIDYVLVDFVHNLGNKISGRPAEAIVHGDVKIFSIALASIFAKVQRDLIMTKFSKKYPGYSFDKNMGYGTVAHLRGIKKLGVCPIHRMTYRPINRLPAILKKV